MGINNAKTKISFFLLLLPLWFLLKTGQLIRKFLSFLLKKVELLLLKTKDADLSKFKSFNHFNLPKYPSEQLKQQIRYFSSLLVKIYQFSVPYLIDFLIVLGRLGQKNIFSLKKPLKKALKLRDYQPIFLANGKSWLNKIHFPKLSLHLPQRKLHKKKRSRAGRPRSRPLLTYLFKYKYVSFFLFFKKIFPSPLRIALITSVLLVIFFFYSFFLIVIARDLPSPTRLSD